VVPPDPCADALVMLRVSGDAPLSDVIVPQRLVPVSSCASTSLLQKNQHKRENKNSDALEFDFQ
jgi:hypothetical protein